MISCSEEEEKIPFQEIAAPSLALFPNLRNSIDTGLPGTCDVVLVAVPIGFNL